MLQLVLCRATHVSDIGMHEPSLAWGILALLKFSKISAKLYSLLYWMSPDHILKLVGWPQARLA